MRAIWGIDFGYSGIKAVRMTRSGGELMITAHDVIPIPPSADPSLPREGLIAQAFEELCVRQRIREHILISVPAKGALTKFIALPPVDKKRIPQIVQYEARQQIPFDLSEVVWGYQTVSKALEPGEQVEIALVAARKDAVSGILNSLGKKVRQLVGIQLAPLALYNFMRFDQAPKAGCVAIDIGADNTDLVILSEKDFWLRNLHVAGNSVNRALEEKFKISFEEAENIKLHAGDSRYRKQITDLVNPIFRELIGEIQRSIGYYKSLAKDVTLEEIVVLGNTTKLVGLERFLAENLQYNVRRLMSLQRIKLGPNVNMKTFSETLPGLAVAIGIGVQGLGLGEIKIDLLPEEFVFERELGRKKGVTVAAFGLLVGALVLGHLNALRTNQVLQSAERGVVRSYQGTLDTAEEYDRLYNEAAAEVNYDRLNFLRGIAYQVGIPSWETAELAQTEPGIRRLGLPRDFWSRALREITNLVPSTIFIRSIKSEIGDPAIIKEREAAREEELEEEEEAAPELLEETFEGRAADPKRHRLVITVEVETDASRGLNHVRQNFIEPLKKVSLIKGKEAFRDVEVLPVTQERRDKVTDEVISSRARPTGPRARTVAPERIATYLVVPVRFVAKSMDDLKAEKMEQE